MASRATDHGRNRGSVSACAMRSRSWCASTTDHEEKVEVSCFCDKEQNVASRVTDHGRNRGSVSAFAMRSRSWRLVPQIMEEIVEAFQLVR